MHINDISFAQRFASEFVEAMRAGDSPGATQPERQEICDVP
jgi:hypothetical protein